MRRIRGLLVSWALIASLTVAAVGLTATAVSADDVCGPGEGTINDRRISIQLFSVRSVIGDLGLPGLLNELATYGYQSIERFGGSFGLEDDEFEDAFRSSGVKSHSSHGSLDFDDFEDELREAKRLGQLFVGSGGFPDPEIDSLEDTLETAENLNILGEMAARRGMKVQPHNHDEEFETKYMYDIDNDGTEELTSAWEIIAANVNPDTVSMQLDVHWARVGLGLENFDEVLRVLREYQDVIDTLHVKDTDEEGDFAYLGEGTTDWAAVFQADPTIRLYIAEHDRPDDALEFAEGAYDYLDCLEF